MVILVFNKTDSKCCLKKMLNENRKMQTRMYFCKCTGCNSMQTMAIFDTNEVATLFFLYILYEKFLEARTILLPENYLAFYF